MTLWQWALVGVIGWLVIALVAGLCIGAILGRISRKLNELEHDWAVEPLTRERVSEDVHLDAAEDEEAIVSASTR
jgi:hypothetical protein